MCVCDGEREEILSLDRRATDYIFRSIRHTEQKKEENPLALQPSKPNGHEYSREGDDNSYGSGQTCNQRNEQGHGETGPEL